MKTCPKCNAPNKDEFMFCENCGNSLKDIQTNQTAGNVIPNTPINTNPVPVNPAPVAPVAPASPAGPVSPAPVSPAPAAPYNQGPVNPVPVTPVVSTAPGAAAPKKSPIFKIILAVAAIGVLIFIIAGIIGNNPTYKLLKGLAKLSEMDKSTMNMDITLGYDGTKEGEVLNDISFKTVVAADTTNLLAETSLELLYKNKSVTKVLGGINNEDVYVDLMNLYKEKFYQDMESLIPDYSDYVNDIKIVMKALKKIDIKADSKKYADIIKDVLGKDIKGSGSKITVTLDAEKAVELMNELLDEAKDDEKLMKSVRTNAIDVIKAILKDKKKLEVIDPDMLEQALETLDDEGDFEDAYQQALEGALSSMDNSVGAVGEEIPEIKLVFNMGMFNTIKSMEYSMSINDGSSDETLDVTLKANIKKGASFTKINKKNAIEIMELVSDQDQMSEVLDGVSENLLKAVEKHEALVETIEELTGQDVEDAMGSLVDEVVGGY